MIFANLDIILKFLKNYREDILFICLSDHGGDESPFS